MRTQVELNSVFTDNGVQLYYKVSNSLGKIWYIPDKNCRQGLKIYQPSSLKGTLLKLLFPFLRRVPFFLKLSGITFQSYSVNPSLFKLLSNLFKTYQIHLSVFCGTPSKHQKLTIQVSNGRRILGYCKVSSKNEIVKIFKHEELILHEIKTKGITEVPICIFNGPLQEKTSLFAQTTIKTQHSHTLHKLTSNHWEFLNQLYLKTNISLFFEETDFYLCLSFLKDLRLILNPKEIDVISLAIKKVETVYGSRKVNFSIYHADFTPWNMFVEDQKLFVFDWEYSLNTAPPYIDAFHFYTQVNIFEKHMNAEKIHIRYKKDKMIFQKYFPDPDFNYLCYLLIVISQYLQREEGKVYGSVKQSMEIWIQMMNKILLTE